MNTTASYSSEHSFSRRCSTESVDSVQGRETDIVRDTSDTEPESGGERVEYEPASEPDHDAGLTSAESSGHSENEIITTKVIAVSVGDDGDLEFADSEQTEHDDSDSELDLHDYWHCAQCRARNNNPLYRYCENCFKVRKNFFPPRPRKHKLKQHLDIVPRTYSQDSGVESAAFSQETYSQESALEANGERSSAETSDKTNVILGRRKRRAESADRHSKRRKLDTDTDSEIDVNDVTPLVKTVSDPSITLKETDVKLTKKVIVNSLKDKLDKDNLCIICFSEPKSGVFVHSRVAHICCCYKCAVKVWSTAKRCPICNCKISNVLKAVVL